MAQEISGAPSRRVALVTGGLDLGGTTVFMCNFAGELIRRNIPAAVFSLSQDHPLASDFRAQNIPVHREDERRHIFEDRLKLLLQRLAAFKPTVVVANLSAASFEVLRYVPEGVVRVGTVQSDDRHWYAMMRPYYAYMDLVAAVSKTIQGKVQSMPEFANVPVCYLPYGVRMPERLCPAVMDPHRPLRILYLGRIEQEQKRVRLFPTILAQLKAAGVPFHWTIAGEGSERLGLQAVMRSDSSQQTVSFPGKVANAEVPSLLSNHDVFLLASDYEGLPLSLLEAMGHGLVPVVSDLPSGTREVVDDTSGIRVAPGNVVGYAAAIFRLHQHRDQLMTFSQCAREKVQREFSVTAMTNRWLAALPRDVPSGINWSERVVVLPILASPHRWRFSPPFRCLRRMLIKFRNPA